MLLRARPYFPRGIRRLAPQSLLRLKHAFSSDSSSSALADADASKEPLAEAEGTPKAPSEEDKTKLEPVDTTTWMELQQETRFVERRIEDHVREHGPVSTEAAYEEAADRLSVPPEAPPLPVPLRLKDPNVVSEDKDVIVRSRTTTGQAIRLPYLNPV
ncbi:hypothetical protein AK812_SmicGene7393 [Symbiodinium microadriaticum]|uniref:Uncharacterized protein n=1 Tax=Symbiodinium microadriaticum TaxID=2951 RepID=A0A1Q9ENN9_SYMMI|nr:hypothetical protein AK812_SmicGene7393 [Symbiodinium microadriaticum]